MKTAEEIIRHVEILKQVHYDMITEEMKKITAEVQDGFEHLDFMSNKITYVQELKGRIASLNTVLEYARRE